MIIDEIVLHNFGVYRGRNVVALTPKSRQRPIILFGGLNGGGKTTFLDALLLVLYGKFAQTSNRNSTGYEEYLRKCINRKVNPREGASLTLSFRHRLDGVDEEVRICRSWRAAGKSIREDVDVYRGGVADPLTAERWYEFVEQLIPQRISHLFFFDGEKVENMASPAEAATLIRTGIYALLGLDQIDTLIADLKVVERRKRTTTIEPKNQDRVDQITAELNALRRETIEINGKNDGLEIQLSDAEDQRKALDARYIEHGGDLYQHREKIRSEHERLRRELSSVEANMRRIAAADAPLILVKEILSDLAKTARDVQSHSIDAKTLKLLRSRDAALTSYLQQIDSLKIDTIVEFLRTDLEQRAAALDQSSPFLDVAPEPIETLLNGPLEDVTQEVATSLRNMSNLWEQLAASDRKLAMIPDPEGLEGISAELQENEKTRIILEHKIEASHQFVADMETKMARLMAERARLLESDARTISKNDKALRAASRCDELCTIMTRFKSEMTTRHIGRLETLILECYQTLLRKGSLITDVKIDPDTFTIHLLNASAQEIALDRLSAGERQLLAVSILWGLGKASGHTLPTIIDTPLGRLDGSHRLNLIKSYFPTASHQVILLSTDKEIDQNYFTELKGSIGRAYEIKYNDDEDSSSVTDGYFWRGAA